MIARSTVISTSFQVGYCSRITAATETNGLGKDVKNPVEVLVCFVGSKKDLTHL
jgi:hypothetical protein